jgi:NTP pyrophosphatase (non-canonical NTP hydrolase)
MTPITHLRSRIDNLSWRIEQTEDATDLRRLAQECNELQRAIHAQEELLKREVADMESAKMQLFRLKARL